ncbi:hypothetical protein [Asticcacaulis sp. YBE204]|uniref:hypothetical protein n=1 Tax=Asticcacaulis sp. YBE204 TaxID=1282363 RepID=UPI0003C3E1B6|nr:hypothetical protein [Asticcacaulis sp. YBE204]ESQ80664.1 hypothetical protein AEYBE204_05175 [Asticcacaulis sp. YBE204]
MFRKIITGVVATAALLAAGQTSALDLTKIQSKTKPVENSKEMYEVCAGVMGMAFINSSNLAESPDKAKKVELLKSIAVVWIAKAAEKNGVTSDAYITKPLTDDINSIQAMPEDVRIFYIGYCLEQTQKMT